MPYHVDLGELFSLYYKSLAVRTIWKSPYLRFPPVHPHLAIAEGEDFRDYVNPIPVTCGKIGNQVKGVGLLGRRKQKGISEKANPEYPKTKLSEHKS